jgi:N-methylhydantoinase A
VGAKTALITTKGMRDIYEIGRENRPDAWDLFFHRPRPLVTREWRFEIRERITAKGDILVPMDEKDLAEVVDLLKGESFDAVAVCFLHSYINPVHERHVGQVLRHALPGVYITLSHELINEIREYERTSTTVLNAYIGPAMGGYLDNLDRRLKQMKFQGNLLIMQSTGGCMSVDVAKEQPVNATESGPVSGVIAACHLTRVIDLPEAIAFDMGGTTAKTAFIKEGTVPIAPGIHIGGYETGQPMMLPVADIIEIGAGGGSIARVDELGVISVGPKSAGADPGPVCYGLGGTEPTVTDANLVIGRLNPKNFLGGEMPLEAAAARQAMKTHIADQKGLTVEASAEAVLEIVTNAMSLAVRRISVERGMDPRDCIIIAFGGAGPLHAASVAKKLSIPKVIIPPMPGMFCALGMLVADLRHDYVQTYLHDLKSADMDLILDYLHGFERQAEATLRSEGAYMDTLTHEVKLDLRYQGQNHVLSVPVTFQELARGDYQSLIGRYDRIHHQYYDQSAPGETVEVVNLRLVARGRSHKDQKEVFPRIAARTERPEDSRRHVFWGSTIGWQETPVYRRENLGAGFRLDGPAIVEEWASTTALYPGDTLSVDQIGNLMVEVV